MNNSNQQYLIDQIYKRFQTTMIGALAKFEQSFGYLWEQDNEKGDEFADLWEYTRNTILNNGNKQARAAINDILNYVDKPKINRKYNYKFNFNENNKGEDSYEN